MGRGSTTILQLRLEGRFVVRKARTVEENEAVRRLVASTSYLNELAEAGVGSDGDQSNLNDMADAIETLANVVKRMRASRPVNR